MTKKQASGPESFGPDGRALWDDVSAVYTLRVDELRVLAAACRALDRSVALTNASVGADLMVRASHGGMQVNPLFTESRQQEALLARLLRQLNLPNPEGSLGALEPGGTDAAAGARSANARSAAHARWGSR
jgi:hypothetical protein